LPSSRYRTTAIIIVLLVMLLSPLLGAAACAQDVSNAIENYRVYANAAALDDKCTILKPDERAVLNVHRDGLVSLIGRTDRRFAATKKSALDSTSRSAAETAGCDGAGPEVRAVYEDTVAINLALNPSLLTIAMNVGERCKAMSAAENGTLMQAWSNVGADVVKNYSTSIRLKYLVHERSAEQAAEKVPCSSARNTVEVALKLARQLLHQ
jgi:hypothetical protein